MNRCFSLLASLLLIISSLSSTVMPVVAQDDRGHQAIIDPTLRQQLQEATPSAIVTVIIELGEKEDLQSISATTRAQRVKSVVTRLQQRAERSQKPIQALLRQRQQEGKVRDFTSFWIFNGLKVSATPAVIAELARMPQVASIAANQRIQAPIAEKIRTGQPIQRNRMEGATSSATAPEANLSLIMAPELWNLGFRGQGIVIASVDTGVDISHPDLADSWRGGSNSWFDPYGEHSTPADIASGHGTTTLGIMVGGDKGGSAIGVAPAAQWIAAKIFNDDGDSFTAEVHAAYQWLLDPDGNADTDDAPHVVNSSWSVEEIGCNLNFASDLQALRAAGILPIFSAGNEGPNADTSKSPANNPGAFAVGAINNNSQIYSYSSRGPASCVMADQSFPRMVAPGVAVRTTDLFGLYAIESGTSVAAPHVAGALALLLNFNPHLSVDQQERALIAGAVDLGNAGADNSYGAGRLNVLQAYQWLVDNPSNQPPQVRAGADITITLPANATLHGTASDDGLPISSTLAITWSMVSGPAVANFANASQLTTTVSFAAAGSYQLRLTADDGLLSSSDTLTVSVQPEPPPNQPPTVDAGSDMSITLPSLLQLQGSVMDDGQPLTATLSTTWSMSSGAGTVNFANRNALSTTAQFSSVGSYRLQLSANDGQFLRSDSVTVTVYPAPPVNLAPIVNAGSDLTVTLPAMATLTGSAQDDGLPVPASLATSWLLVSGPGSVIFGNQTSPTTTAQFVVAGSYLLHLTASDGERSALDEVTITVLPVPPVNRAPNVWAGDDITLTLPASVPVSVTTKLVGQVSDDGLPQNGQLTIGWSVLSSSGAFSISHSSQVTTSLSFASPGNYLLQLTAADGELEASDEILITVNAEAEKQRFVFLPLVAR